MPERPEEIFARRLERTLRDMKQKYTDRIGKGFTYEFVIGYQQGLAEARGVLEDMIEEFRKTSAT